MTVATLMVAKDAALVGDTVARAELLAEFSEFKRLRRITGRASRWGRPRFGRWAIARQDANELRWLSRRLASVNDATRFPYLPLGNKYVPLNVRKPGWVAP